MNDDDDFDWDGIDFTPPDSIVNVTVLTDIDLIDRYQEILEEILQRKEALNPTTDTGRDLHSARTACLVEMAKRGLR